MSAVAPSPESMEEFSHMESTMNKSQNQSTTEEKAMADLQSDRTLKRIEFDMKHGWRYFVFQEVTPLVLLMGCILEWFRRVGTKHAMENLQMKVLSISLAIGFAVFLVELATVPRRARRELQEMNFQISSSHLIHIFIGSSGIVSLQRCPIHNIKKVKITANFLQKWFKVQNIDVVMVDQSVLTLEAVAGAQQLCELISKYSRQAERSRKLSSWRVSRRNVQLVEEESEAVN